MNTPAAGSLGRLEHWFLHAPARFLVAGVGLWVGWAISIGLLAASVRVERAVTPVLGQAPPPIEAFEVLVAAPLIENTLLWAIFSAAYFFARQWLPGRAGTVAVGVAAGAFAVGHWPFKVLFGIEVLAGGWLMSMCFLWGARHRRRWRGWTLSVAAHVAVNALALALFHA